MTPGRFEWHTPGQSVRYGWMSPMVGSTNSLGSISLTIPGEEGGKKSISLPVTIKPSAAALRFQRADCSATEQGISLEMAFGDGTRDVQVKAAAHVAGRGLALEVSADELSVAELNVAPWPVTVRAESIPVPYYSGGVAYLPSLDLFANSYFDWQHSHSSQLTRTGAQYALLTNGRRNSFFERFLLTASKEVDDVLPDIPNPKSPYLAEVSGRTVLDVWGTGFAELADALADLGTNGLTHCVVLIHTWQAGGYDNGLPQHLPANAGLGGDRELARAILVARQLGCLAGLHENYVDYYPNFEGFTQKAIALTTEGKSKLAWYNSQTRVQSFATKPTWFLKNAGTQSPEIHRRYQTGASFLDVNSAVVPWWRTDMEADTEGAGMFSTFVNASRDLWSFERRAHAGPVFGEGKNHWYWSGLLDGVEAQIGSEDAKSQSTSQPLFVDFDLLKIHPLEVNHGMGYYERWLPPDSHIEDTKLADAYRMQEVIFGHAPFLSGTVWKEPLRAMVEQDLAGAVARRYGVATVNAIRYEVNGKWTGTTAATKAHDWSRVEVTYSNGDTIVANSKANTLSWKGIEVPQFGWAAIGPQFLAYTALRNGMVVDYAESPNSYFANARNQTDLANSGTLAEPEVKGFRQTGTRAGAIELQWRVMDQRAPAELSQFVHFVSVQNLAVREGIAFQADRWPAVPASEWKPGQTIRDTPLAVKVPAGVPDGTYSVRTGLYSPATGRRMKLKGNDDGTGRYILGNLVISDRGNTLRLESAAVVGGAKRLADTEGSLVDFGAIQTDGMLSITADHGEWSLRTYPRYRAVTVQLDSRRFVKPATLTCDGGKTALPAPASNNSFWEVQMRGEESCHWADK